MEWYELLITDEFLNYFNKDHTVHDPTPGGENGHKAEPIFEKFTSTVMGITYAFLRFTNTPAMLSSMKETQPDIYSAYANCKKCMPPVLSLADIWHSIKGGKGIFPYQVEVETLSAEQIAILILYPFWSRMGSSFEFHFLQSGNMKRYLMELKKRSKDSHV